VAFGNPAKMMQQVQQMQADMARVQEELGAMTVDGTAGGGAVTATVTGHGQLVGVTISKDVVDPDDVEMLQDLVTAAVNDGLNRVKQVTEEKMGQVTGGLSIPGLL
jgi:DNA-binding YbaB/EbfC family protein